MLANLLEGAVDDSLPPLLPPGWVELEDPQTQAIYFYNEQTFESRWERPGPSNSIILSPNPNPNPNLTSPMPNFQFSARSNATEWDMEFDSSSNYPYYINKKTNQTQWEMPSSMAATPHRTPLKTITANTPKTINTINPGTLVSPSPFKAQINPGTLVSPSPFKIPATPQSHSQSQSQSVALPPPWVELFDYDANLPYYQNNVTGESSWTRPTPDQLLPALTPSASNSVILQAPAMAIASTNTNTNTNTRSIPNTPDFPGPMSSRKFMLWEELYDTDNQTHYYFNVATEQSQWDPPEGWPYSNPPPNFLLGPRSSTPVPVPVPVFVPTIPTPVHPIPTPVHPHPSVTKMNHLNSPSPSAFASHSTSTPSKKWKKVSERSGALMKTRAFRFVLCFGPPLKNTLAQKDALGRSRHRVQF